MATRVVNSVKSRNLGSKPKTLSNFHFLIWPHKTTLYLSFQVAGTWAKCSSVVGRLELSSQSVLGLSKISLFKLSFSLRTFDFFFLTNGSITKQVLF